MIDKQRVQCWRGIVFNNIENNPDIPDQKKKDNTQPKQQLNRDFNPDIPDIIDITPVNPVNDVNPKSPIKINFPLKLPSTIKCIKCNSINVNTYSDQIICFDNAKRMKY